MKKILVAFVVAILLLSGCSGAPSDPVSSGISQEDYDAIVAERDSLMSENQTLKSQIQQALATTAAPAPASTPEPKVEESGDDQSAKALGDAFTVDDWDLTIGTVMKWDTVNNRYSDYNGHDVIAFFVSGVNKSGESKSFYSGRMEAYSPSGTKLSNVDSYFDDAFCDIKVRDGAVAEGYVYFIYDGDGDYIIEFDDRTNFYELTIPVTK